MGDSGLDLVTGGSSGRGHRRAERPPSAPWGRRIITVLIAVVVIFGVVKAYGVVSDHLGGPADYSGTGTGKVTVEIPKGSTGTQIANILEKDGVVKSADAFYQLALKDSRFQAVQAGFFTLRKQMSADAALGALVDKRNRAQGTVTIPEGSRVGQIVTAIVKGSDIKQSALTAALKKPETLGLPSVANNNPEGYLFPATYSVEPGMTATELLRQMVAKTLSVAKNLDIGTRAKALGLTGEQILTVASILEYEGKRTEDLPKIARVLYNRLNKGMMLQLDSTVSYVSKRKGDVWTTPAERNNESAYNTYKHTGLPPGPIGSPGEKTIEAALNPASGTWLYFLAINLKTGETAFSDTYAQHVAQCKKAFGADTQC